MTVMYESSFRGWSRDSQQHAVCLEDKFEVIKDVGDGSFGSVALARVRSGGAYIAKRGTLVAIKTMKKTFESFSQCMELREVIFLRTLPGHVHLVPALDIFLDPFSKKLHIAMEYMDGNLYQLMKARDHKPLDGSSVKSILFQIIGGLEHIHQHEFFHRDIKPENILVSTSSQQETGGAFRRYSSMVTPPSTPPVYFIKIADFGLARETHSRLPYTTYVSTRWYRAPEVLLRAGEYSAPVDIWAIGAMAVEIATLKPLFPGGNEVDQVWRVCEIMGSPGAWLNKQGQKVGGGEWKEGVRLAQKLGFSFPKMAPHSMETILTAPQWPASLAHFVTWCLMWDPKVRPTSTQALQHEYFNDAIDPLRPKSSASRLMGRKQSDVGSIATGKESIDSSNSNSKTSWFRRSLVARESAPAVPQHVTVQKPPSPRPSPVPPQVQQIEAVKNQSRPSPPKRANWTNGAGNAPANNGAAPIPILPSIRPISPLSDTVNAQASVQHSNNDVASRKIGRQLSVASHGNHYADVHRQEAERALNGQVTSPPSSHKEGFFSHLRKRARRFSGRYQTPMSPSHDEVETSVGCVPWGSSSNRHSLVMDQNGHPVQQQQQGPTNSDLTDLDRALQGVRYSLEATAHTTSVTPKNVRVAANPLLKRHHSLPQTETRSMENLHGAASRARKAGHMQANMTSRYETPDEEDELLSEALNNAHSAATHLDHGNMNTPMKSGGLHAYLTPSHSANKNGVLFGQNQYITPTKPLNINKPLPPKDEQPKWPTPPYEESDWAAGLTASLFAAGSNFP